MQSQNDSAGGPGPSPRQRIVKHLAVIGALVLTGFLFLPILVYFVGRAVFGEYGAAGFPAFYGQLHQDLRNGEPAAALLLFSPCLFWLLLRLTLWGFRRTGSRSPEAP